VTTGDDDWPWEYLYTMATVYLSRSENEFWMMTPRVLIAMIDEWKKIEKNREAMAAYIANGGDPEAVAASPDEVLKAEYEMGDAMW
jgi:hypothetical protein